MAVSGEVTTAALHTAAWWLERSDAECDAFAGAARRATRPDAAAFRDWLEVDQADPVLSSGANYNAATTVTFGSTISYLANGKTFYVSGNGGNVNETPPATFAQVPVADDR